MPFASTSTARSVHRDALEVGVPLSCGCSESTYEVCSQTFTVLSKDEDARIVPNSGCAQLSFDTAAS